MDTIIQTNSFTNWNLSIDYDIDSFDETLFTQIDYNLLKSNEVVDSLFVLPDKQSITVLKDSIEISKTFTEISESDKNIIFHESNLLKNNNSLLMMILASVVIVGFVRLSWKDYIINILRSIFFQGSERKISSSNMSFTYPAFLLNFLFFFNVKIFIYEIYKLTNFTDLGIDLLIIPIVFTALLIIFSLKNIILRFIGYIFDTLPQIKSYIRGSTLLGQAFSVIILPVVGLIPFLTETIQLYFFKIGIGVFIVMYLMQLRRGVKIILKETFYFYYIILYLCALEILPLLYIINIISNQL